jgi:hypothetical protein
MCLPEMLNGRAGKAIIMKTKLFEIMTKVGIRTAGYKF